MAYEDIIRVADLKTRSSRFQRVRKEVGAKDGEPVVVIDYLKPGVEEFASVLPHYLGKKIIGWAERRGKLDAYNFGMHIRTSGIFGYAAGAQPGVAQALAAVSATATARSSS